MVGEAVGATIHLVKVAHPSWVEVAEVEEETDHRSWVEVAEVEEETDPVRVRVVVLVVVLLLVLVVKVEVDRSEEGVLLLVHSRLVIPLQDHHQSYLINRLIQWTLALVRLAVVVAKEVSLVVAKVSLVVGQLFPLCLHPVRMVVDSAMHFPY
jgi:hypothetical protein